MLSIRIVHRFPYSLFIVAAISALCAEGVCALWFNKFGDDTDFFELEGVAPNNSDFKKFAQYFSASLGWEPYFPTKYGERPAPNNEIFPPLISTYGDSFTYGGEVMDGETWQFHLSDQLKHGVLNFGVGAYGTDQALLRFMAKSQEIHTPIVVLGLITENINRIVNVYRRFYHPIERWYHTKPRFTLDNSKLRLIPNPIAAATVEEFNKLRDPDTLRQIGRHDHWYNIRRTFPSRRFPYLRIVLNPTFWRSAIARTYHGTLEQFVTPWPDLWKQEEPKALMFAIIDAFVREVKAKNSTPIVMVLPVKDELWSRTSRDPEAGIAKLSQFCAEQGYLCFEPSAQIMLRSDSGNALKGLFKEYHYSPRGNRLIADLFAEYLATNGLLPGRFAASSLSSGTLGSHSPSPVIDN